MPNVVIPAGATPMREPRLDPIRTICTLHDHFVDGDGGLKDLVKAAMGAAGAEYAESDLVIAQLRASSKSSIDTHKVFALTKGKRPAVTLDQFLDCCTVQKKKLVRLLGENAIDALSSPAGDSAKALYTEFKPAFEIPAAIDTAAILQSIIKKAVRAKK